MASIQFKKGKTGRKTYYVVICHQGGHKWVHVKLRTAPNTVKRCLSVLILICE